MTSRRYWISPEGPIPQAFLDEVERMRLAWNEMVKLGEASRVKWEASLANADSEYAELSKRLVEVGAQLEAKRLELKRLKQKERRGQSVHQSALRDEINRLQEEARNLKALRRERRESSRKAAADALADLTRQFNEGLRAIARRYNLYWVHEELLVRRFRTAYFRGFKTGNFPRYHGPDSQWSIVHRFTGGGLPVERLFRNRFTRGNYRLALRPVHIPQEARRSERRRAMRTTGIFTFRGESLSFKTIIHQPVPEDAFVKTAVLSCRREGTRLRYYLSLILEVPPREVPKPVSKPAAGMDVGWRLRPDGLRVAYLCDETGHEEEVLLPWDVLRISELADFERSVMDSTMNATKAKVVELLQNVPVPEDIRRKLTGIQKMGARSLERLADQLAGIPEGEPTASLIRETLEIWKRYINRYAAMERRRTERRRHFYLNLAHRLCRRYGSIVVQQINLPELLENQPAPAVRRLQSIASVGSLIRALKQVAPKYGTEIIESDSAYVTVACHHCGHINATSRELWIRCEACGQEYDCDANAARNLLSRFLGYPAQAGVQDGNSRRIATPELAPVRGETLITGPVVRS